MVEKPSGGWTSTGSLILLASMAAAQAASLCLRLLKRDPGDGPLLVGLIAASLVAAVVIAALPRKALRLARRLTTPGSATSQLASSGALRALVVALLVLSACTQQLYWDENGILLAARGIAEHGISGLLEQYRVNAWLGPQHPPLVPILYGIALAIPGADLLVLRMVDVAFAYGSFLLADAVLTRLVGRERAVTALLLLLASPLFLRLGSAVTNDVPMFFFFLLALHAGLRVLDKPTDLRALQLGLAVAAAVLAKYTAVFVLLPLLAMPLCLGRVEQPTRRLAVSAASAALLLGIWLVVALRWDLLGPQLDKVSGFAGNAMDSGIFFRLLAEMLMTRIPSAIGIYVLPILALGLLRTWPPNRSDAFLATWAFAVILPVLLTAPLARYMLPAFPALAALASRGVPANSDSQARILLLALVLAVLTLIYYVGVDLQVGMELLPGTSLKLG